MVATQNRMTPFVFLALFIVGCGGGPSDQPELGEVSGVVRKDGETVEGATVYFSPEGGGRTVDAITDANGRYTLSYTGDASGAAIGTNVVRITTATEAVIDDDGKVITEAKPELASPEYTDGSKTVDVKAGEQEFDFDI